MCMDSVIVFRVAFLQSIAFVCFISCIYVVFYRHIDNTKRMLIMHMNICTGFLCLFDSIIYLYKNQPGQIEYIILRVSNFITFFTSDLVVFFFTMYMTYLLFEKFGITTDIPCKKRIRTIYYLCILGMSLVIFSQFTGIYYYIDEVNKYHRGNFFYVSVLIPMISMFIGLSILFQYRKNILKQNYIALLMMYIIPGIGLIIQFFVSGKSLVNISIGFAMIILFIDCFVSQSKKVDKLITTEIRTGLSNEHGCLELLNSLKGKPEILEYATVFFDLAHFANINRRYGNALGNTIIAEYSKKLASKFDDDELLARQGSDLFIAVVKKVNLPSMLKALKGLEVTVNDNDNEIIVLISAVAGVYEIDNIEMDGEEIIANANMALYHAKNVSKKLVAYMTSELRMILDEKRAFEESIPIALKNDEFEPFYQPKVDSLTDTLYGAEALVRWRHNGVLVPPIKFIPLMEKNDSICDLDFYMLRRVCFDISSWIEQGLDVVPVSVNISRRNLSNPNLADHIDKIVRAFGIPKHLIQIEITETIDEFPMVILRAFVDALHSYGYTVAIDDFGSGSSSLSLLREVNFDVLKIDKGFVDHAYSKDITILAHIIDMAKSIGLEVVAEGVELREQITILQSLNCNKIQGYYYDKPLCRDDMVLRLKEHHYLKND